MDASALCVRIDRDFDLAHCRGDWSSHMTLTDHYTDTFRQRSMGLMLDNARDVRRVFTAVFPSARVLDRLLQSDSADSLLVPHHAMHWDIRRRPAFIAIDEPRLNVLRDHRITWARTPR